MSQGTAVMPTTGPLSMASYSALVNTGFAAAISQSAGAIAPTTALNGQPTQGQPWLDNSITVPKLRLYDGSTWPTLFYISTAFHVAAVVSQSSDSVVASTASLTLAAAHYGRTILMNSSLANTVTIPASSAVNFPIGTEGSVIMYGVGQTKVTPGSSVTIRSIKGTSVNVSAQYGRLSWKKIGVDEWQISGDASTV